jgi:hypothetical protein
VSLSYSITVLEMLPRITIIEKIKYPNTLKLFSY